MKRRIQNSCSPNTCQPLVQPINDPSSMSNTYYNKCCPPNMNMNININCNTDTNCVMKLSSNCVYYSGLDYPDFNIFRNDDLTKIIQNLVSRSGSDVVITEDSNTIQFSGSGTTQSPLTANFIGSFPSQLTLYNGDGTILSNRIVTLNGNILFEGTTQTITNQLISGNKSAIFRLNANTPSVQLFTSNSISGIGTSIGVESTSPYLNLYKNVGGTQTNIIQIDATDNSIAFPQITNASLITDDAGKVIAGPPIVLPVNADWNSTSGLSMILNKPTIPSPQINSDWNSVSGVSMILNKPILSNVATSGDYNDLTNKPNITNIYNSDGNLTTNRTLTGNGHDLSFLFDNGTDNSRVSFNSSGVTLSAGLVSSPFDDQYIIINPYNVNISGKLSILKEYQSIVFNEYQNSNPNLVFTTDDTGKLIFKDLSTSSVNIYNTDGILTGSRMVTGGTHSLDFLFDGGTGNDYSDLFITNTGININNNFDASNIRSGISVSNGAVVLSSNVISQPALSVKVTPTNIQIQRNAINLWSIDISGNTVQNGTATGKPATGPNHFVTKAQLDATSTLQTVTTNGNTTDNFIVLSPASDLGQIKNINGLHFGNYLGNSMILSGNPVASTYLPLNITSKGMTLNCDSGILSILASGNGSGIDIQSNFSDIKLHGNTGVKINSGVSLPIVRTTSNISLNDSHYTVVCMTATNIINVTLPDASTCPGRVYVIKRLGANDVSINPMSPQTFEQPGAATSLSISSDGKQITIQSDGVSSWVITSGVY